MRVAGGADGRAIGDSDIDGFDVPAHLPDGVDDSVSEPRPHRRADADGPSDGDTDRRPDGDAATHGEADPTPDRPADPGPHPEPDAASAQPAHPERFTNERPGRPDVRHGWPGR
jgi:hypothetical protein